MIAVDTSALIAIFDREDDSERYKKAIDDAEALCIAAPTVLEVTKVVFHRRGPHGVMQAKAYLEAMLFEVVAFDQQMLEFAEHAVLRFPGAPSKLNYGDCFAYALAKSRDIPLIFKGSDFLHTDLAAVDL
ncbi:MAG: type II toxin-antitoxin system VapC family toxin [Myxococcota bacterium]